MPRKVDQQEILQRFNKTHKNFYDYSKVSYTRMWDKVTIICPKHGEFKQAPVNHINGMGCRECGKEHGGPTSILSLKDFIKKSKKLFGPNTFNYSKVVYSNSRQEVILKCNKHNFEFKIKVNTHFTKPAGCPLCGKIQGAEKLRNTFKKFQSFEEFKKAANKIHKSRYLYKPFNYNNGRESFELKCPQHGWFKQRLSNHLEGRGCEKCATLITSQKLSMSSNDFLKAAKMVHGNTYDYSRARYKSSHTKVTIICKKHGPFQQTPASHLKGRNCIKCGFDKVSAGNRLTPEQFIKRAKKIHRTKFDYSKLVYTNANSKVTIICKKHGPFDQYAAAHLNGIGCPGCSRSKGEEAIAILLKKEKIRFIHQWRNHDCRDKGGLAFDFYLPNHSAIIEYDGIQHFVPISFGGKQSEAEIQASFDQLRLRDLLKQKWAKKNGLRLFRIKYSDNLELSFKKIILKL